MRIEQIGKPKNNIIETILNNREIDNVDLFLNPDNSTDTNPYDFYNMEEAIKELLGNVVANAYIAIVVDPDVDGYMSASMIYQYLKNLSPGLQIDYIMQEDKKHGLTEHVMDQMSQQPYDLIITPDSASNDNEQIQRLSFMNADVIIIDHHEVEIIPPFATIVNNQLYQNKNTNRNLVGAGMVLRFLQAIDDNLSKQISLNLYDMAAIGQVGDASDISDNEVRNIVFQGLNNIYNPFISNMLEQLKGTTENLTPKDLSFSVIPIINAVTRMGKEDEKRLLFEALNGINGDQTHTVTKKKKNKSTGKFDKYEVIQSHNDYVFDVCKKVKTRQDNLVRETVKQIKDTVDTSGGVAISIADMKDTSITGLVATKIAKEYKMPALVLHKSENLYRGSGRGYEKVLPSLKDWCNSTELVEFAQGHANAFGIGFETSNLDAIKKRTAMVNKEELTHYVDAVYDGYVSDKDIKEVDNFEYLFGGKVEYPVFAYKNIVVPKKSINIRGGLMKFFVDGVEFVKFNASKEEVESIENNFNRSFTINFVGQPGIDDYQNKNSPQVILDDFEIVEDIEDTGFSFQNGEIIF